MQKDIDLEDWNSFRNKNLKKKKYVKIVEKSYNEYDTYYLENDFDR